MNNQEDIVVGAPSNDAAIEAQTTIGNISSGGAGNAMLDAEVTMTKELDETAIDQPVASNTPDSAPPEKPVMETTGAYPSDFNQLTNQENLAVAKDSADENS